jgi:hypothetical protein
MDLMGLLQGHLSEDVLAQLSQQTGASPEQTQTAAQGVLSTLLGGLAKNASQAGGAESILNALNTDNHSSVLGDIMGLVMGGAQGQGATNGAGILGHILGGQQQNAAQMVSQASGVSQNGVMDMMIKFAPLVMGVLSQANQQQSRGMDASGLAGLLSGAVQQQQNQNPLMAMATRFLDKDGDGSAMDDIMGMVGSKLLGGMFKR